MVAGGKALSGEIAGLAHCFAYHEVVFPAEGYVVEDRVRQQPQQFGETGLGLLPGLVGLADRGRQILGPGQQLLPLLTGGLGDLAADVLLLGPQRLVAADRRPPRLVGGE